MKVEELKRLLEDVPDYWEAYVVTSEDCVYSVETVEPIQDVTRSVTAPGIAIHF